MPWSNVAARIEQGNTYVEQTLVVRLVFPFLFGSFALFLALLASAVVATRWWVVTVSLLWKFLWMPN